MIAQKDNLSGNVFQFQNKEPLENAYVYSVKQKKGVYTNSEGFFTLRKFAKNDSILFFKEGFQLQYKLVTKNKFLKIFLEENKEQLKEVQLSNAEISVIKSVNSGRVVFSEKEIEKMPYILGEKDVLKILQYIPGVQQSKEGQSGLLVRGGNGSMNLTYIDAIYLHNTSHLGGLFTTVNSDFIKKVTFSKSGFDGSFGGRLSSITEIETKNTNKSFFADGSIGLVSSKLTLGTFIKDVKTSVLVSGRRTYLDLLQSFYQSKITENDNSLLGEGKRYYFYDYLFKLKTQLTNKDQIGITFYKTLDNYSDSEGENTKKTVWGNQLMGLQWKHQFSNNWISKFSLGKSDYNLTFDGAVFPYNYSFKNKYQLIAVKQVFQTNYKKHIIRFGGEFKSIENLPRNIEGSIQEVPIVVENQNTFFYQDISIFIDDQVEITDKLKMKLGFRFTSFDDLYAVIEPRLNMNYEFKPSQFFKASYQNVNQFVHQAAVSSQSTPIDFYLPSTKTLKPQNANQLSFGYGRIFELFSLEVDTYYKHVKNYVEFKNGSLRNLFNNDIYGDIVVGTLKSYGAEFLLKYKNNNFTSSVSYTYSKTKAKFEDINKGNEFPVVFDRPHNFNSMFSYAVNDRLTLGALFVLTSGQTYTPAKDLRIINEEAVITFGNRNSYRYPTYHRLDLSATYLLKEKEQWKSQLNLTIYNAYNRKNPFHINYNIASNLEENSIESEVEVETLFPLIPTLSWVFSFE